VEASPSLWRTLASSNALLAMFQYAASKRHVFHQLHLAAALSPRPLGPGDGHAGTGAVALRRGGAVSSGWLVSHLYGQGAKVASRRAPAIAGFLISAVGLVLCALAAPDSPWSFVLCYGVAVFGAK